MQISKRNNNIIISFKYDPYLVEVIRQIGDRKFDNRAKCWIVPMSQLETVLNRLPTLGFVADAEILEEFEKLKAIRDKLEKLRMGDFTETETRLLAETALPLFQFQKEGASFLHAAKNALNGDQPGLGKTIQAIAAIKMRKCKKILYFTYATLKATVEEEFKLRAPELSSIIIKGEKTQRDEKWSQDANVYIANYELLLRDLPEMQKIKWDVIIADECHRGYTSKETAIWRSTLDYFDAIKIGLTATPAAHTTAYFGQPIYRYTTEQAILDGYLVDYEPIKITSNVLMNGAFLKEGEHVGIIDTDTGKETYDELEDEREFHAEEIERKITSPETNLKIIQELAKYAYEHEKETERFPKILIFAVNDLQFTSHADQIVQICKEVFNQGDDFVKKITGNPNVDRPLQRIREFRNRPNPKIVVTIDMLSTGVDIPALEFVVFMRPVKSRILWVQMLGRGTRLCPEINKDKFLIFDCFGGSLIEYFKNTTDFQIEAPQKEPLTIQQIIENIYQNEKVTLFKVK